MRALLAMLALVVACGDDLLTRDAAPELVAHEAPEACPPVRLTGDPAVPSSVVISNGIARVTFPGGATGELGRHRLEVLAPDGWRHATEPYYGDWSFYASPWQRDPHRVNVLTETDDLVEAAWEWDHTFDRPGSAPGGCYLWQCGIVGRWITGQALSGLPMITGVRLWKVIGMRRCFPGYFIGYHTDPPLHWGSWIEGKPREQALGEREIGLGWIAGVTWSSAGVVVRNPAAGHHVDLGILEQATGPWWFATVPVPMGNPIRVASFLSLDHPLESWVWQFAPTHQGVPLVHFVNSQLGADGRPERYQVAIGAVVYESPDLAAEPTPLVRALVEAALPVWP